MIFTVGTTDLRRALLAVQPHICPYDEMPSLQRVRLALGPVNVTVAATDRYTAGYAIASVLDHGDGDMGSVDLSAQDVKEILLLFKGKGTDADGDPAAVLRIEVTGKHTTVTDVSGLWDGKSLRLDRYPDADDFPNLERLLATVIRKEPVGATRLVTAGAYPKRFAAAASAYGEPLVLTPTGEGHTLLVRCGQSFIGLWMPTSPSPEDDADLRRWADEWLDRLPAPAAVDDLEALTGVRVDTVEDLQRQWTPTVISADEDPLVEPPDEEVAPEAPTDVVDRALLADAARLVITVGYASAAMLQRKLRIGAGLAGLVMDALYARGIVGDGGRDDRRDVLIAADRAEQSAGAILTGADGDPQDLPGNVVDLGERRDRGTDEDDE